MLITHIRVKNYDSLSLSLFEIFCALDEQLLSFYDFNPDFIDQNRNLPRL